MQDDNIQLENKDASEETANAFTGLSLEEIEAWLLEKGFPKYRGKQLVQWLYEKRVTHWDEMNNVPKELKQALVAHFNLFTCKLVNSVKSEDGTIKVLMEWSDGRLTETVIIPSKKRITVCLSSQVGCPVKCSFCASGLKGLERSLTSGEIVEQLLLAQRAIGADERVSNIVMMGMGEPLANYTNVLKAITTMNAKWGFGIGARHITVSTVGLPDRIKSLAHEPMQLTLAVSLHAGDEDIRKKIIPWANKFTIEDIFEAIDYFYEVTHREVTLEYILLDGVNTSEQSAHKLANWAKKSRCNVNLINYNEVDDMPFKRCSEEKVELFISLLKKRGVNANYRRSRGRDVDAACGQLKRRFIQLKTGYKN
jgi:23S rRNA (adenine2503-C2)-methyltransferase